MGGLFYWPDATVGTLGAQCRLDDVRVGVNGPNCFNTNVNKWPSEKNDGGTANAYAVQSFTSRIHLRVSKDTSLVWRETAKEDLCLAVACACWVAESCQRGWPSASESTTHTGRYRRRTAAANAGAEDDSER